MAFNPLGAFSQDVAVDLGRANVVVYVPGRGIVLNEPSVIAITEARGPMQILAGGKADGRANTWKHPSGSTAARRSHR